MGSDCARKRKTKAGRESQENIVIEFSEGRNPPPDLKTIQHHSPNETTILEISNESLFRGFFSSNLIGFINNYVWNYV